ncbi:hypothetical protein F4808DRAFT_72728 [Astrocystis sublimbata]|nr:hypothetical protein F4808DRAFT_72728 [Astrocystis sublimbata]
MASIDIRSFNDPLVQRGYELSQRDLLNSNNDKQPTNSNEIKSAQDLPAGYDLRKVNEVIKTIVIKGAELAAESAASLIPGIGLLVPTVTAGLDSILETPKSKEDALADKVDGLKNQLTIVAQDNDENQLVSNITARLEKVHEASIYIKGKWGAIREAQVTGHTKSLLEVMESIETRHDQGMRSRLEKIHEQLIDNSMPDFATAGNRSLTRSLLGSINNLLKERMRSEDRHFDYDLIRYHKDIKSWFEYVSDIQTKGTALLVLSYMFELVLDRNSNTYDKIKHVELERQVKNLIEFGKEQYDKRIKKYRELLIDDVLLYKSAALLVQESELHHPTLFFLKKQSSGNYLKIHSRNRDVGMMNRTLLDLCDLAELDPKYADFTHGFSLARCTDESSMWHVRGSRHALWSEHHLESATLRPYDYTKTDEYFGLYDISEFTGVKIIALKDVNSEPLIRICYPNSKDPSKMTKSLNKLDVFLVKSLSQMMKQPFVDRMEVEQHFYGKPRALLHINNKTSSLVLVLQDIRQTKKTQLYHPGLICLAGQNTWAGMGENLGASFLIKFRAFKLKSSQAKPSRRSDIEPLVCVNPTNGRPTLKKAHAVRDIVIKCWCPLGLKSNYISAVSYSTEDTVAELPNSPQEFHYEKLEADLDEQCVVQNDSKVSTASSGFKMTYKISGSDHPVAVLDIEDA